MQDYHSHIALWEVAPVRIINVHHGLLRQKEHGRIPCVNAGVFVCIWGQSGRLWADDTPYDIRRHHIFHFGQTAEIVMSSTGSWLEYYIVSYQAEFPLLSRAETARLAEAGNPFSASYGFRPFSPVFFTSCFKEMADCWGSQTSLERLRAKSLLYRMVYQLYLELHGEKASLTRPNAFEQAKQYMDRHYSEPISVGLLTDLLQISAAHLNRLFKKHTGQSPRQYLMGLRMAAAEELLAASAMTLGEVADACGFQDKFHLSHVFKDHFGLPPGAYRKANPRQSLMKDEISTGKTGCVAIITNLDRVTRYHSVPERIVCLSYPEAEICVALGLADKLAGIAPAEGSVEDCFSGYRERLLRIPVIPNDSCGRNLPAFETICKLRPDFVYGTAYAFRGGSGIADPGDFEKTGARIYAAKGTYTLGCTLGDVYEDILNIGRIFDVERRAAGIIDSMRQTVMGLEEAFCNITHPQKVFVFDQGIRQEAFTAGLSLESAIIRLAGGVNVFGDIPSQFAVVNWTRVAKANPDVILVHQFHSEKEVKKKIDVLRRQHELRDVPAIRNERIFPVRLSHVFPGLHNTSMAVRLAAMLYPDRFDHPVLSGNVQLPAI